MPAQLIDGKAIAQEVREAVAEEVAKTYKSGGQGPPLPLCWLGTEQTRPRMFHQRGKPALNWVWVRISEHLPADATQEQVEELVKRLNAEPQVSGILVQLPIQAHINEERVLSLIKRTWMDAHQYRATSPKGAGTTIRAVYSLWLYLLARTGRGKNGGGGGVAGSNHARDARTLLIGKMNGHGFHWPGGRRPSRSPGLAANR